MSQNILKLTQIVGFQEKVNIPRQVLKIHHFLHTEISSHIFRILNQYKQAVISFPSAIEMQFVSFGRFFGMGNKLYFDFIRDSKHKMLENPHRK